MLSMTKFFQNYTIGKRIFLHLCFWLVVLGMQFVVYQRIDFSNSWILFSKDVFSLLTIFYVTAYIIIPRWFIPGKFVLCILWLIFIYAWWSFLSYFAGILTLHYLSPGPRLANYIKDVEDQGIFGAFKPSSISDYLLDFIFLVALPLTVKIVQAFMLVRSSKMELELKNAELELNNVQLELAFLKYQINPHFLLNTLYSIYVLVSDRDERGGESMMRLSSIMVYLLHESNQPSIEISREFQLLKDYVELEKLRYSETVKIDLILSAENENCMLVPLIFFPFVENAFKHGPRLSASSGWISIRIVVKNDTVYMHVSNAYRELPKPENYVGGLGIENVRKRLELHYRDNYNLEIKSEEGVFSVNLVVTLLPEENP